MRAAQATGFLSGSRRVFSGTVWILVFCFLGALTQGTAKNGKELSPAERKGGIISKLPKYVTGWPKPNSEVTTLGVLGQHAVTSLVKTLLSNSPEVRVLTVNSAADVAKCNILFIPSASQRKWAEIRSKLDTRHIFTVGEERGVAQLGAVLVIEQNSSGQTTLMYSKGNYQLAKERGLRISSKLFRIAKRID